MTDDVDSPPLFTATLHEPRLPGYSLTSVPRLSAPRVEHTYSLNSSNGNPWLNLKLKSYAASPQALPLFHQGNLGIIQGEVSIDTSELSKIKSVTIVVSDNQVFCFY
jgi:hypothetical protein